MFQGSTIPPFDGGNQFGVFWIRPGFVAKDCWLLGEPEFSNLKNQNVDYCELPSPPPYPSTSTSISEGVSSSGVGVGLA